MQQQRLIRAQFFALAFTSIIVSCGPDPMTAQDPASKRERFSVFKRTDAEALIKLQLRDPSSATFRNEMVLVLNGKPAVCGEVNSKNAYGALTGFQRWIIWERRLVTDENTDTATMDGFWQKICSPSNDPTDAQINAIGDGPWM